MVELSKVPNILRQVASDATTSRLARLPGQLFMKHLVLFLLELLKKVALKLNISTSMLNMIFFFDV